MSPCYSRCWAGEWRSPWLPPAICELLADAFLGRVPLTGQVMAR